MEFDTIQGFSTPTHIVNYGYLKTSLPENIVEELDLIYQEILKTKPAEKSYRNYLAGEIEHEYMINFGENFTKYLYELVNHFEHRSNGYIKNVLSNFPLGSLAREAADNRIIEDVDRNINKRFSYDLPEMKLMNGWVNLQKKHEYNPMHKHSGLLSFVVWHKIPYLKEDEINREGGRYKRERQIDLSGDFCFVHHDGKGIGSKCLPVDNSWEGTIALFPSDLHHCVYPFYTSDEYRVTFSGNIYIKDEKSLIDFKYKE